MRECVNSPFRVVTPSCVGRCRECEPLSEESVGRMMGDESGEPEPESEDVEVEEWSGVARLLVVGGSRSEARGFPLATVVEPNAVGLTRFGWQR